MTNDGYIIKEQPGWTAYSILGLPEDASHEDIKQRYRELAKKYHPNNFPKKDFPDEVSEKIWREKVQEMTQAMAVINRAHDRIKTPRVRAQYDLELRTRQRANQAQQGASNASGPDASNGNGQGSNQQAGNGTGQNQNAGGEQNFHTDINPVIRGLKLYGFDTENPNTLSKQVSEYLKYLQKDHRSASTRWLEGDDIKRLNESIPSILRMACVICRRDPTKYDSVQAFLNAPGNSITLERVGKFFGFSPEEFRAALQHTVQKEPGAKAKQTHNGAPQEPPRQEPPRQEYRQDPLIEKLETIARNPQVEFHKLGSNPRSAVQNYLEMRREMQRKYLISSPETTRNLQTINRFIYEKVFNRYPQVEFGPNASLHDENSPVSIIDDILRYENAQRPGGVRPHDLANAASSDIYLDQLSSFFGVTPNELKKRFQDLAGVHFVPSNGSPGPTARNAEKYKDVTREDLREARRRRATLDSDPENLSAEQAAPDSGSQNPFAGMSTRMPPSPKEKKNPGWFGGPRR